MTVTVTVIIDMVMAVGVKVLTKVDNKGNLSKSKIDC